MGADGLAYHAQRGCLRECEPIKLNFFLGFWRPS